MKVLDNLKYTNDHEWAKVEGDIAIVGLTDYAQTQLGDVVFIDVNTEGETLEKGEVFGAVEAVKTVADMYMPVGGEIIEFNPELKDAPDLINKDPYGNGWMIKIRMTNPDELNELLDAEQYKKLIA